MLSLFQLHGVSSRKCKLLLLSCCAAGDLLDIFPFLSSQTMPTQERTARCLKAPMENMKIILGSSGVRSSVCSVVLLSPCFSAVHVAHFSAAEGEERQSGWSEFSLHMVK